jgi:hydroxymethylpyrimidine pyrophosphatase-like HAD family hydrolase
MSVSERSPARSSPLAGRELVIATDLDGTFLGGTDEDRTKLYAWLRRNREGVGLIFVTGRSFDMVEPFLDDPTLPLPDLVIADVGASVGEGKPLTPVAAIEDCLRENWPGREAVRALFSDFGPLVEQTVPQRGRVSFMVTDSALVEACRGRAASRGLSVVYSRGRYLDVLPANVDKGRTLLAVLDHFGVAPERVLACGDTLNDLSLFGIGLRAVAVGGSELALLEATRGYAGAYHAVAAGAGGISEAISHFFGEREDELAAPFGDPCP